MLEEGAVISVATPTPRRIARWWLIALAAPFLTELFGWLLDVLLYLARAKKFGAWLYVAPPPVPIVQAFVPFYTYFLAVFASLAIVARFGDRRSVALGCLLVAPLGFATVRAEIGEWNAIPVTRSIAMVPACASGSSDELLQDGRDLELVEADRINLVGARARLDLRSGDLLIYVSGESEDALAGHTTMMARRVEGTPCRRDALIIDGQVRSIATVTSPLLWGSLALTHTKGQANQHLFEELTKP